MDKEMFVWVEKDIGHRRKRTGFSTFDPASQDSCDKQHKNSKNSSSEKKEKRKRILIGTETTKTKETQLTLNKGL